MDPIYRMEKDMSQNGRMQTKGDSATGYPMGVAGRKPARIMGMTSPDTPSDFREKQEVNEWAD